MYAVLCPSPFYRLLSLVINLLSSQGAADPLNSAFRLTYNMVLNLLRLEEINPEYMLSKSFYQFQNYAGIPKLLEGNPRISNHAFLFYVIPCLSNDPL